MEQAAARLLHQRAKRVFLRAVDASPERRRRLIEEACADDPALRAEVERLLANAHSDTADLSRSSYLASPPKPEVRFEANARVGDRYRIERRIGSGGMADVYLAFDELLDQRVALKFPTRGALAATGELDGLLREARAAREVIHPNVCRVFDAGVFEKEPFLSLEFVEGENLGHRIAREGPLPREELRSLAIGLARALDAIHACGLVHRDLKPANVLLEHAGRILLTDFGIAIRQEDAALGAPAGTPGYLAPEVLRGGVPSVASDLFAFGKVLLEATTGEPAPTHDDDGSVDTDLVAFQAVAKTDPILHRVIDTCLREQPSDRPTSAALIVRALESADPLDAILVLGEHPSPNMIQASRARGLLNPRTGSWVFVGALALAAALMALRPHVESMEVAGLGSPPEQRVETVRTLLNAVVPERDDGRALWGYTEIDVHRLPGVPYPRGLVRSGDDVMFWYREAMDLANLNAIDLVANGGRVSFFQPDRNEWGSTTVALDPQGRLFHFQYTPLPNTPEGSQGEPDWARFFEAADLDPRRMREVDLQLPLPVASDRRSTWRGQLEGRSTLVEAASLGRTPTLFLVLQTATEQDGDSGIYARQDAAYQIVYFAAAALLVVLAVPAARNLRAGRGDPWGAFKLAVIILIVTFASFLSQADHRVSPADEAIFVLLGLAGSLLKALGVWLLYMAIEPIVQQYWPRALVSWSRVLHGRQTDPIVASHLLLGLALGAAFAVLRELEILAVGLTAGAELPLPHSLPLALPELRHGFGALLNAPFEGVFSALLLLAVLAACRLVLKFPPAAFLAAVALFSLQPLLSSPSPAATVLFYSLATTTIGIRVVTHYGLATYVVAQTVVEIFRQFPLTADPNSWYLGSTATALGVFLAAGFVAILRLTTHDPRPL